MLLTNQVALVLEGGGFRGMYTAAVLDVLLSEKIYFDYLIAVSAGAACGISYVTGQVGRSLEQNKYVTDNRYCSLSNLIKKGNYFNWDFVFHTIPTQLIPLNYGVFAASHPKMKVVVSNIMTGLPEYKELKTGSPSEIKDLLTATSSLPLISRPYYLNRRLYMDGGLSDSIPVKYALSDGNQRAVVVLTRERGYRKKPMQMVFLLRMMYRRYPHLVNMMLTRANQYNESLDLLEKLEDEGKVYVIRPEKPIAVSRLENNPENLKAVYNDALLQMEEELPRLYAWLTKTDIYNENMVYA